jgi:hypothetical protein
MPFATGVGRVAIDAFLEGAKDAAIDLAGVAERDLVSTMLLHSSFWSFVV